MPVFVQLTFHGDLKALLSRPRRAGTVDYEIRDRPAVKDAIEACGIPHTEVDLIVGQGRSLDFSHQLNGGEQLDIYPPGYAVAVAGARHLVERGRPERFILDVHLGKLARKLRLLGFDCHYRNDLDDPEIIDVALREGRTILTADRGLLKHKRVVSGLLIRSTQIEKQLEQVLRRYELQERMLPFRRCPHCNGLLHSVAKAKIAHLLPAGTGRRYDVFRQCDECGKVYWRGTHHEKIAAWLESLRNRAHK